MEKDNECPEIEAGDIRMDVDPIKVDRKTLCCLRKTMKTKSVITGDVFITPNGLCTANDIWDEGTRYGMYLSAVENGIHFDADKTKFIELWYCTPNGENSNWRDHCIDGHAELAYWRPITSRLPVELFKGKKEGDIVTVELPITGWTALNPVRKIDNPPAGCKMPNGVTVTTHVTVSLRLSQLKYRYRRFGTFEEVLEKLGA